MWTHWLAALVMEWGQGLPAGLLPLKNSFEGKSGSRGEERMMARCKEQLL